MFMFNIPPTAKVSSNRLVKPGIEPATPGLQGDWFIHFITAAPAVVEGRLDDGLNIDLHTYK